MKPKKLNLKLLWMQFTDFLYPRLRLRRTDAHTQCLDHVQPRVKAGCNSYRNLVSFCLECNSQKGEQSAADFFRSLYRDRRLTASEFQAGLRRLDALAAGKLPQPVQNPDTSIYPDQTRVGDSASSARFVAPKGRPRRQYDF